MTYAPCPDCKQRQMCAKCRSDIAEAVHFVSQREMADLDLFMEKRQDKAKNWLGGDGDVFSK